MNGAMFSAGKPRLDACLVKNAQAIQARYCIALQKGFKANQAFVVIAILFQHGRWHQNFVGVECIQR
jgi:hypothetical protein